MAVFYPSAKKQSLYFTARQHFISVFQTTFKPVSYQKDMEWYFWVDVAGVSFTSSEI